MPRVGEVAPGVPNEVYRREMYKVLAASAVPRGDKVRYVKRSGQTRNHHCHWPGCGEQVPPAKWGCLKHWRKLPKALRDRVWAAFRPGQETNWTPSREYVKVAREIQDWISENYPETREARHHS